MHRRVLAVALLLAADAASAAPPEDEGDSPPPPSGEADAPGATSTRLRRALGADDTPDGTIVQIDRDTVYLDLGGGRAQGKAGILNGLVPGTSLHVLRTVIIKHPVTGEQLIDHFPIGTLSVAEVGKVLSTGKLERRLVGVVKLGDVVKFGLPAAPAPVAKAPLEPPPRRSAAAADREASELGSIWQLTLGRPPDERVRLLNGYLDAHPKSPYAADLRREVTSFVSIENHLHEATRIAAQAVNTAQQAAAEVTAAQEAARAASRAAAEVANPYAAPAKPGASALRIDGHLPERIYEGDALEIALTVNDESQVGAAFAYVRQPSDTTFHTLPLAPDGDGYFRAIAPAAWVMPPVVQVFVGVVDRKGKEHLAFGKPSEPRDITVEKQPAGPAVAEPGHSSINGFFEYVDFNSFKGNDYYYQAEADFLYRLGIPVLYSVRMGFGVLNGTGGSVKDLDTPGSANCKTDPHDARCGREVGYNYGYIEGEFHFAELFGVAARLSAGHAIDLDASKAAGHSVGTGGIGGELRLRIGRENGTNLQLGGSLLRNIGALGIVQLQWDVIKNLPMTGSVIVTNQPAEGDIAVRLGLQIAYRGNPHIQPAIRVGYDVRTFTHNGPSFGFGLVSSW